MLDERRETGQVEAHYAYGPDRLALTGGDAILFYQEDGLGSVRLLTDSSGTATDAYSFDAYGNLTAASGPTENPYLYAGERFDSAVGLYHLRLRWLDPRTGRFVSRDVFPGLAHDPSTLHRYGYAHADPVNNVDPSGMMTLAEQQAVRAMQDILQEVGSYLKTFLNLLDKVETAVDVIQTLQAVLSVAHGGAGFNVRDLVEMLEFEIGEFNAEDAGRSLANTMNPVIGLAAHPWGLYALKHKPIREILIYLPNVSDAAKLSGGFSAPPIGRHRIPVRFELGGPGSKRITGAGLGFKGAGIGGMDRQQIFRMELDTSPTAAGGTVIVDPPFRYVVRRTPGL